MTEDLLHPSSAFLRSIDVHQLLPQQDPFVMVGHMVAFDGLTTTTETPVTSDCLFVDDEGVLSTEGMIENVAQTCAVHIGYVGKYIEHRDVVVGVVGAISGLKAYGQPCVGDVLVTTITVEQEVFGITLVSAKVECGGHIMLTTAMKLGVRPLP